MKPRIAARCISLAFFFLGFSLEAADYPNDADRVDQRFVKTARSGESSHVTTAELFAPMSTLDMKVKSSGGGKVERTGKQWRVTGKAPFRVVFVPAVTEQWDVSASRLVGVSLLNQDSGVVTVGGRLNNDKATDWSLHALGFAVAPSGEAATLGFPFPIPEDRYHGPNVFKDQLGKPNGHRLHWRQFYPEEVRTFTLDIKSSTGKVDLLLNDPFLAWPATPEMDSKLQAMPYLDALGQVRAVDWPGKAKTVDEARVLLEAELAEAATKAKNRKLSRYGGWLDGPKLEATGHFRTEKRDGKWWLVDPEGYLFFSVGTCLGGHKSETAITKKRIDAGFFEYLPDNQDALYEVGRVKKDKREVANFLAMNYARTLGKNWEAKDRDGVHHRLRAWGMNTLGAWSDESLQKDGRTPYTLIASPGWTGANPNGFPAPFFDRFEEEMRTALQRYSWAKDDPYFLGIFIGNELDWPDRFTDMVFELKDNHSTKQWVLNTLKKKHTEINRLNKAWKTSFTDWNQVLTAEPEAIPEASREDIEPLYREFTTSYFTKCKAAVNKVLPHKLYLGCRSHRGPPVIGQGAVGHVDIFSVNVYDARVRAPQVPSNIDMPIIASEFHFGAVDRGVPSPGLSGSWDQRQRGLAFCNYLASALADPRFVGVHWFQWLDQSAAGRPDRENHNCGLIDVTGRSYPEFVELVSRATQAMYPARLMKASTTEKILEELIQ